MDFNTNFSYDFLPEEGGSVFKDKPSKQKKQTKAHAAKKKVEAEVKEERKFDAKKMIIYSEIMNPKFKE